jgi:small subunit ribosomal protein S16
LAAKIRLTRLGRRHRPSYRIVVTDSRSPRDGRYIECIGLYNPINHPPDLQVKEDRANYWLDCGAVPSDTVNSLLKRQGVLYKRFLKRRGLEEAQIEEEMKKWEVLQIERQRREDTKAEEKRKAKAEAKIKAKAEEAKPAETATEPESAEPKTEASEPEEVKPEVKTVEGAEESAPEMKEEVVQPVISSDEKEVKEVEVKEESESPESTEANSQEVREEASQNEVSSEKKNVKEVEMKVETKSPEAVSESVETEKTEEKEIADEAKSEDDTKES